MKGRKIEGMGVSSRGMYMRNIADITPKMEGYTHCRYNTKWELFTQ